ncbi:glycosyltransferase family 9 protein [Thiohalobacter sp. IOR34]|uniref:glycosyltransferase family 9 protein n=1 Tax=Thiohalobacter sp. IOR34 TaxID=3057176 RepID=UPI0025AF04AC|nr:glycosyltransferase family 9 protein [Thiohalobacter sp. IOR34]WJW75268.1 glycosyltransferase family 9 protein [Thiohalobacter sp. IOR34]
MIRSILLISLSNIGDAVMTTPVLERLHQLHPEAVIDIVGDRRSSRIFHHCPYRGHIFHKEKKRGWRGVLALVGQLRRQRYDLVVDLRTDGLAYLLRARRRLVKWGRRPYGPHAVEDLISIIDPINPGQRIPPPRVWLGHEEEDAAKHLLQDLPGPRRLALAPGANWSGKIWPAERFAALANRLGDHFDGVLLLGGPGDQERCAEVARQLQLPALDLAGQTDLLTASALIARCRLLVGNDSGLGHLASGVGTPTLTVFGPGRPERYHPWGAANRWRVGADRSLERLRVEEVEAAARELLEAGTDA